MKKRGFFIIGYGGWVRVGSKVRHFIYNYTGTVVHKPNDKGEVGVIWNFNEHAITWVNKFRLEVTD